MDQKKPVLTFVTGVNGAGKSTYMADFEKDSDRPLEIFNPDSVAKKILAKNPNFGRLSLGKGVVRDLDYKLSLKKDLVIETTLSGASMLGRIRKAKQDGFRVNMVFVSLDKLETHINRVAARVKKGGHNVEAKDIKRRFQTSYENFKKIAPQVDSLTVYDNTLQMVKVLEVQNGKVKYAGQLNDKLQEIFPGLQKIRNQKKPKLSAVETLKLKREKQAQSKGLSR